MENGFVLPQIIFPTYAPAKTLAEGGITIRAHPASDGKNNMLRKNGTPVRILSTYDVTKITQKNTVAPAIIENAPFTAFHISISPFKIMLDFW